MTRRGWSQQGTGALAPLRVALFRALWTASLISGIGGWMQTVGAQWFLVENHSDAALVAPIFPRASLKRAVF